MLAIRFHPLRNAVVNTRAVVKKSENQKCINQKAWIYISLSDLTTCPSVYLNQNALICANIVLYLGPNIDK